MGPTLFATGPKILPKPNWSAGNSCYSLGQIRIETALYLYTMQDHSLFHIRHSNTQWSGIVPVNIGNQGQVQHLSISLYSKLDVSSLQAIETE